ncbi:MAG: ABC transporter ATP-binding protein [Rhodobacteraceae bacterium]|uniref:ABC transporter ATP-binding protein n=1 Tax=Amaricoccus sp. B4 TaxID=3368557 RepID=UPI000DAF19AD|nr:ABC transporter ATP-binding protein [Paracoccaceae bacterium]
MTPAPAVTVEGSARLGQQPLFPPVSLRLGAGEWTCLLGPSGVGKSSLLRIIAGLETGIDFTGHVTTGDGAPLAGRIAYMAQSDLLFPWRSVTENVLLGAALRGTAPDRARARELIGRVGLTDHAGKRPAALSGGQRQRAALARTLMEDRPVILLDEPFSALDARNRAAMQSLAASLLAGRTVLLVTHDPAEAARLGHRILVIDEAGLREMPRPEMPPLRPVSDPATLEIQMALFAELGRGAE